MHEFPSVSANYHAPNLCDTLRPPDGEDTGMEAAHYTVTSVEPYVLSSELDTPLWPVLESLHVWMEVCTANRRVDMKRKVTLDLPRILRNF